MGPVGLSMMVAEGDTEGATTRGEEGATTMMAEDGVRAIRRTATTEGEATKGRAAATGGRAAATEGGVATTTGVGASKTTSTAKGDAVGTLTRTTTKVAGEATRRMTSGEAGEADHGEVSGATSAVLEILEVKAAGAETAARLLQGEDTGTPTGNGETGMKSSCHRT